MSVKALSPRRDRHPVRPLRACLLGTAAALGLVASAAAPALAETAPGSFRLVTINTWGDQFVNNMAAIKDVFINGNYDVIAFQELRNESYMSQLQTILAEAGRGDYIYRKYSDNGVLSRLPGALGQNAQGDGVPFQIAEIGGGAPNTVIGSVHLDYRDPSGTRLNEVAGITNWMKTVQGPVILTGDWNAGDVSERGLHRASQQKLILQNYLRSNNSFYGQLLQEYAVDSTAMADFIAANRGRSLSLSEIPDSLFADEMYPVASNTPVTMNALKRNFILLQREDEREGFAPHDFDDGSTTWPSAGEDATNTWPSWDRVRIDHFLASRPYGKWFTIVDDPEDPYLGTLDQVDTTATGQAYTDHELVAHEIRWIGPQLDAYTGADASQKTRLTWGAGAVTFAEAEGEFYLSRNNMRRDVYLGQISDAQGNPILQGLTEAEKTTLLDCSSTDARLAQAIVDYCIDDHSFIGETLVQDGGTLVVAEDAALGGADAQLRLNGGGLAVAGLAMGKLDRGVVLEGSGGWLDIRAEGAVVEAAQAISGTGALVKRGAGSLILSADNSYSGATRVEAGLLVVDGSIANSALTTVAAGAALGGHGTTGSLRFDSGATLAAGNSIGMVTVAGDLSFGPGAIFEIEADASGAADHVAVTGAVTIEGGTALALAEGGAYRPHTYYRVMDAAGGITGRFDTVTSALAFLDASLSYGETTLDLTLSRNDTAFHTVANTGNAKAAALAIEPLGMDNPLYDAVVMLGADTATAAFDALSGEVYAASHGALAETSAGVAQAWSRQSRLNRGEGAGDGTGDGTGRFWVSAYGESADMAAEGDLSQARRKAVATLMGFDARLESGLDLGLMAGFGTSQARLAGKPGQVDSDDLHLGLSLGQQFGATSLRAGALYSRSQLDSWRSVAFTGFDQRLAGSGAADTTQVFAEIAHSFALPQGMVQPFLTLAHVSVKTDGFAETGGSAALSLSDDSYEASFADLGLRLETGLGEGLRLTGEASWRHALSGETAAATLGFAGSDSFTVEGAGIAGDVARLSVGLAIDVTERGTIALGYSGAFGDGADASSLQASFGLKF